jgi:hypothetical protein
MEVDLAFGEDVQTLGINPELTDIQQEGMRGVVRRQHTACAYGR